MSKAQHTTGFAHTTLELELIERNKELLEALETVLQMDVKGHELQDRLQFSDKGREILNKCRSAIAKAKGE